MDQHSPQPPQAEPPKAVPTVPEPTMPEPTAATPVRRDGRRVALVLQGGGALGAYQAGVYEALHDTGLGLDWIAGVSIGAINGALIAGNPPARRVEALRSFWTTITRDRLGSSWPDGDIFRQFRNEASAALTMLQGQPGFFAPNSPSPWFSAPGAATATAFYDNAPLRRTLRDLVDYDLLNDGQIRFSVGAVNVRSGNFAFFDSSKMRITEDHILASGALPPALPMSRIGTDFYWDGGLVSNTPLQHLLENLECRDTLAFQVDLFSAQGAVPRTMPAVMARMKDIQYSSRTRLVTDTHRRIRQLEIELYRALQQIPEAQLDTAQREMKQRLAALPEVVILQMIYQQQVHEGQSKDYEFSTAAMRDHWRSGADDTRATLQHGHWLAMPAPGSGIQVHDVHRP